MPFAIICADNPAKAFMGRKMPQANCLEPNMILP